LARAPRSGAGSRPARRAVWSWAARNRGGPAPPRPDPSSPASDSSRRGSSGCGRRSRGARPRSGVRRSPWRTTPPAPDARRARARAARRARRGAWSAPRTAAAQSRSGSAARSHAHGGAEQAANRRCLAEVHGVVGDGRGAEAIGLGDALPELLHPAGIRAERSGGDGAIDVERRDHLVPGAHAQLGGDLARALANGVAVGARG